MMEKGIPRVDDLINEMIRRGWRENTGEWSTTEGTRGKGNGGCEEGRGASGSS